MSLKAVCPCSLFFTDAKLIIMSRFANVAIFYQPRSAVAISAKSNFIILAVISGDSLVLRARTQGQPAKER
jgi:hypothetical protein